MKKYSLQVIGSQRYNYTVLADFHISGDGSYTFFIFEGEGDNKTATLIASYPIRITIILSIEDQTPFFEI